MTGGEPPIPTDVDTAEDLRQPERLRREWSTAAVIVVDEQWRFEMVADGLRRVDAARFGVEPPPGAVMIGRSGGRDYWAVRRARVGATGYDAVAVAADGRSASLRSVGAELATDEAALATSALALLQWHDRTRFCPRCGRAMTAVFGGHSAQCVSGHEEFPRTDPAVIVLVHDGADHIVLGRNAAWPSGRFSVLAGFVEAGESLATAVTREIAEEVGIAVEEVDYLGSQPWPFPRSLMVAFRARASRGAELTPRPGEIAEARWFSRAELRELLAADDAGAPAAAITLPGRWSIARRMIASYAAGGL